MLGARERGYKSYKTVKDGEFTEQLSNCKSCQQGQFYDVSY
jgi:hypothetical protein